MNIKEFFQQVISTSEKANWRYAAVLDGSRVFISEVLAMLSEEVQSTPIQLGGVPFDNTQFIPFNKGQFILGHNNRLVIIDCSAGIDANSINSAIGSVCGGGVLLFIRPLQTPSNRAVQWFDSQLDKLPTVNSESDYECLLPCCGESLCATPNFSHQEIVVKELIALKRRRANRPIVITADRGRGKTTAIGLACVALLQQYCGINLSVCAPRLDSVRGIFDIVESRVPDSLRQSHGAISIGSSTLTFISPDSLVENDHDIDILFVDEASSIPLTILFQIAELYSRIAFSTTVNGYEGCGRGFTLKFVDWLKSFRPEFKVLTMEYPIRWNTGDPVEEWTNSTFLLDSKSNDYSGCTLDDERQFNFVTFSSAELFENAIRLNDIFQLLVDAHYQTSPNDLFHLISDDSVSVTCLYYGDRLVSCLMSVAEPSMDDELIEAVSLGRRRPKGMMTPITFVNQIGIKEGGKQSWYRILRIVVAPELQAQGVGSKLLSFFIQNNPSQFISTSYGATAELFRFWQGSGFIPVKLGTQKDAASGCFSVLMVHGSHLKANFVKKAYDYFRSTLILSIRLNSIRLELTLSHYLLGHSSSSVSSEFPFELLSNYAYGGSNFEAIVPWFESLYYKVDVSERGLFGDVFVLKIIYNLEWKECARQLSLPGRRQVEQLLRSNLKDILSIYTVN
ncbi:GNAT family N-acetyltransferase [Vibrio sp.]|nr:GNAT family N-acetyltransferase [Vibrio sp.]